METCFIMGCLQVVAALEYVHGADAAPQLFKSLMYLSRNSSEAGGDAAVRALCTAVEFECADSSRWGDKAGDLSNVLHTARWAAAAEGVWLLFFLC